MENIEENLLNKIYLYLLNLIEERPVGLNGINQAEASLRSYVITLLGLVLPLLKNSTSGIHGLYSSITNSLQESLIKYDHMYTYIVEFCKVENDLKVSKKISSNLVTINLIKELSRLNFNNLTGQGIKNIASFIDLFSKNCTKIFYNFLPHLIRLIDSPPHQIRSAVIQAMGHVIHYIHNVLTKEQNKKTSIEERTEGEAEMEENKNDEEEEIINQSILIKQRDTLLDILIERTHDVNPYTRSALLKNWIYLVSTSSLPVKRYRNLVDVARNRLEDRNFLVRKQALSLLSILITKNPYASVLNSAVFIGESNKLCKEIENRVEELSEINNSTNSNLTSIEKKILEITNNAGGGEEENLQNGAPLITEEELLNEVNEIELRNNLKNDDKMNELKLKLDYINSSVEFIQSLELTLSKILTLMDSKTNSDVIESLSFLSKAVNFQVSGALNLFKYSFKLIWHHEESIINELLNSFNLIYLTDGACDINNNVDIASPTTSNKNLNANYLSSKEISLNLINLVHTCSTNELISLEKILKLTFPDDFDFNELFLSLINFSKYYYKEINDIVNSTSHSLTSNGNTSTTNSLTQNISTFNRRQSLLRNLVQEGEIEKVEAESKLQEESKSVNKDLLILTDNDELNKKIKNFSSCFYLISIILTNKNAELDFDTLNQLLTLASSDLIFSCGDFFSLKSIVVSMSITYDKILKKKEESSIKVQNNEADMFKFNNFNNLENDEKKFFNAILKSLIKKFFLIFNKKYNFYINFLFSLFEEIIFLIYKISLEPDEIMEKLIKKLFYLLYYSNGNNNESNIIENDDIENLNDDSEKLNTEVISSKINDITSEKNFINSNELSGFIFIIGQVALCTLVQAEELGNNVRKKIKNDIEKNKEDDEEKEVEEIETVNVKSKKKKQNEDIEEEEEDEDEDQDEGSVKKRKVIKKKSKPTNKKPVDDFEEQMGMIQAVDAEQELELNYLIEKEIVIENLLGQFIPLIKYILANDSNSFNNLTLRSSCILTLCKCISLSNELCESSLPLLFTILKNETSISIKTTIIIALGDISFRFPNLIEPWTKNFFSLLIDTNSIIRYNTLLIISHLLLNDMIKLKGNIINLIICLNDKEVYIQNLVKNFFIKFSERSSNPIYNLLPDVISYFSNEKLIEEFQHELEDEEKEKEKDTSSTNTISISSLETRKKLFLTNSEYEKSIKFLLGFIHKDKQNDLLCERLLIRLKQNESTIGRRRISFSISLLILSEKFLVKLKEQFKLIRTMLLDDEIFSHFKSLIQKMKQKSRIGNANANSSNTTANLNANSALPTEETETTGGSTTIQKSILEEVEAALYSALNGDEDDNYENKNSNETKENLIESSDKKAEKTDKKVTKSSRNAKNTSKAPSKPTAKAAPKKKLTKKKVESDDDDDDMDFDDEED